MKNFRFGVRQQIFLGFLIVILLFVVNVVLTLYYNQVNNNIAIRNIEVINPSKDVIDRFRTMVLNSEKLITNWVYLSQNKEDKNELRALHTQKFPALREEIIRLSKKWEDREQKAMMDEILDDFSILLEAQDSIMTQLVTFEDYDDPLKKWSNEEKLDQRVLPLSSDISERLDVLSEAKNNEVTESQEAQIASFQFMDRIVITLFVIVLVIGIIAALITANRITRPLKILQNILLKLGRGELPERTKYNFGNNEIGEMATAVQNLAEALRDTSRFAQNIGGGNLNAQFQPLSSEDVLGNSLLTMRENLRSVAEEDKKRNWATEGLAKFSEILRHNTNDINALAEEIITELVRYLDANQGAIFVIHKEEHEEPYLTNAATYAWDRVKFIEQKIYIGEGLVGQSWQEQDTLNITEVPEDYIAITSGTGKAKPSAILIVPLIVNEEVFGVLEIAGFNPFEDYQVEFIKKVGESIASTLNTVKVNEQTSQLLEDSQALTEQMRAQEEEMRQNMEELQATQEEVERKSIDMEEALRAYEERERKLREEKIGLERTLLDKEKQIEEFKKQYVS